MMNIVNKIIFFIFILLLIIVSIFSLFPRDALNSYKECVKAYGTESFNYGEELVLETLCLADNYDFETLCKIYPSSDIEQKIAAYISSCQKMESRCFRSKDISLQQFKNEQLNIGKSVTFHFAESGALLPPTFSVRVIGDLDSTKKHLTGVVERFFEEQFKKGYASDRLTGGINLFFEFENLEISCIITQSATFYALEWEISSEVKSSAHYREMTNKEFDTIREVATYSQGFPFGLRSWVKGDKEK